MFTVLHSVYTVDLLIRVYYRVKQYILGITLTDSIHALRFVSILVQVYQVILPLLLQTCRTHATGGVYHFCYGSTPHKTN